MPDTWSLRTTGEPRSAAWVQTCGARVDNGNEHPYPKQLSIHRCIHAIDKPATKTQHPCGFRPTSRFRPEHHQQVQAINATPLNPRSSSETRVFLLPAHPITLPGTSRHSLHKGHAHPRRIQDRELARPPGPFAQQPIRMHTPTLLATPI